MPWKCSALLSNSSQATTVSSRVRLHPLWLRTRRADCTTCAGLLKTVDELTFAARRAVASLPKTTEGADLETRFRNLVQSPLRAGLLRFLSARPEESFDVEVLMSTFGRLRLDVENCLNELVGFGVV